MGALTVSIVILYYHKAKLIAVFYVDMVSNFCKTTNSLNTLFTMQKLIENGMTHFCVYFLTFCNVFVAPHIQITFKNILTCIQPE